MLDVPLVELYRKAFNPAAHDDAVSREQAPAGLLLGVPQPPRMGAGAAARRRLRASHDRGPAALPTHACPAFVRRVRPQTRRAPRGRDGDGQDGHHGHRDPLAVGRRTGPQSADRRAVARCPENLARRFQFVGTPDRSEMARPSGQDRSKADTEAARGPAESVSGGPGVRGRDHQPRETSSGSTRRSGNSGSRGRSIVWSTTRAAASKRERSGPPTATSRNTGSTPASANT